MNSAALDRSQPLPAAPVTPLPPHSKLGWACRALDPGEAYALLPDRSMPPRVGDVALFRVSSIGNHTRIITAQNLRERLYEGDRIVGTFGNRYATDAFEARVDGLEPLHIVTNAGMVATVRSRCLEVKPATTVRFLGYVGDARGQVVNLRDVSRRQGRLERLEAPLVLVVGTGMNAGKTTCAARLTRALTDRGLRVASCKLTGSVSPGDVLEQQAAGAVDSRDFSDYGLPSTYLASRAELRRLYAAMTSDVAKARPDLVLMEVADGLLQRETAMVLTDAAIRRDVAGVVLAARCAPAALDALSRIERAGHRALLVSGVITNSPLFVRELQAHTGTLVACARTDQDGTARRVLSALELPM